MNEISSLVQRLNNEIRSEKNMRIALSTTLAIHKPRIFERGETAGGSKIGKYSTKKASISKKSQARDTGKTYFKGGYSEYKSDVGKNPGFVILRNTDQMYADYGIVSSGNGFGFGFQNEFNANKSGWNEDHFNKDIFQLNDKEIEVVTNTLTALVFK